MRPEDVTSHGDAHNFQHNSEELLIQQQQNRIDQLIKRRNQSSATVSTTTVAYMRIATVVDICLQHCPTASAPVLCCCIPKLFAALIQ
jgi:hypothetical protein